MGSLISWFGKIIIGFFLIVRCWSINWHKINLGQNEEFYRGYTDVVFEETAIIDDAYSDLEKNNYKNIELYSSFEIFEISFFVT